MLLQAVILLFLALFIGISNSAGIGGGSIINVLLITGLSYSAKESIVISYIFLMGGGLASTLTGAMKHTASGQRCIDYDLVILTLPMMMSGAIVGAILNQIISQLFITIIFIILIINLMINSYTKLRETEKEQCSTQKQIIDEGKIQNVSVASTQQNTKEEFFKKQRLQKILSQQKALIPMDKLKFLCAIYLYTITIILLRGGKTFESAIGIQSCGIVSYSLVLLHILFSYFICKKIEVSILQRQKQKEELGFEYNDLEQKHSLTKMNTNMMTGFIVGVLGSMIGMGGGLILVPVWLKAGMQKDVVVNSTPPLIFFLASISFLSSVLLGQYSSFGVVAMYFCLSFTGSYLVKRFINFLTEKYGLKRLIYILLLVLMLSSLLAFLPIQIIKFKADPSDFVQFGSFC